MKIVRILFIMVFCFNLQAQKDTVYIKTAIDTDSIKDSNLYLIDGYKFKNLLSLIYGCQEWKVKYENLLQQNNKAVIRKRKKKKND